MMHVPSNSLLFERLQVDPSARQAIIEAHVVFGVSTEDGTHTIFYGTAILKRIVQNGKEKTMRVVHVPIDWESEDPEVLAAFCITFKGSHDWDGTPTINIQFN